MSKYSIKNSAALLLYCFLLMGCYKNNTNYYPDAEDRGVSIFSDRGNNVMSCFIAGKTWRTIDRKVSGFSPRTVYEVYIQKQITGSLLDTIVISWQGYYNESKDAQGALSLVLAVHKNFTAADFSALQGKRLVIDSLQNGFFSDGISGLRNKGNGSIYFHTARLDSIGPGFPIGTMSGLFEANFSSYKITRGRFDETLDGGNTVL